MSTAAPNLATIASTIASDTARPVYAMRELSEVGISITLLMQPPELHRWPTAGYLHSVQCCLIGPWEQVQELSLTCA